MEYIDRFVKVGGLMHDGSVRARVDSPFTEVELNHFIDGEDMKDGVVFTDDFIELFVEGKEVMGFDKFHPHTLVNAEHRQEMLERTAAYCDVALIQKQETADYKSPQELAYLYGFRDTVIKALVTQDGFDAVVEYRETGLSLRGKWRYYEGSISAERA
jgi:hypothetical protein